MSKETRYIGFCSSKGGVGKSTITMVTASYLHYVKGLNVAIIDCDYPIRTVVQVREREIKIVNQSPEHQGMMSAQYKATGQKIYPVIPSSPTEALGDLDAFLKNDGRQFDVIIFDLPGTTNTAGVLSTMACLDHVFIPISPDTLVMESTLLLVHILYDSIIGRKEYALKGAHLFWTRIDKRIKPIVYDRYNEVIGQFGLNRMEATIPSRSGFQREISPEEITPYRSTLFAPDRRFVRESNLAQFVDEVCSIIKLPGYGKEE